MALPNLPVLHQPPDIIVTSPVPPLQRPDTSQLLPRPISPSLPGPGGPEARALQEVNLGLNSALAICQLYGLQQDFI